MRPRPPGAHSPPCDLFSTDRIYTDHRDALCFNKIEIDCCQCGRVGGFSCRLRRERWGTEARQAGVCGFPFCLQPDACACVVRRGCCSAAGSAGTAGAPASSQPRGRGSRGRRAVGHGASRRGRGWREAPGRDPAGSRRVGGGPARRRGLPGRWPGSSVPSPRGPHFPLPQTCFLSP